MANQEKKFTRKAYTIKEKLNVIRFHESNPMYSQRDLHKRFGISLGVINDILKNKAI